jgi:hypothetical protein
MSGAMAEVQALADEILTLLGVRIRSGELVVRYNEGDVIKCETRTVHRPVARAAPRPQPNVHTGRQP